MRASDHANAPSSPYSIATPEVGEDERFSDPPASRTFRREGDASAKSVFRVGDVVAFRFRIIRYLARGGMGELYEAQDLELHERVDLKTILSSTADSERSITLFKREVHLARAARSMDHR